MLTKSLENGDIIKADDERYSTIYKWQMVPAHWVGTSYRKTVNGAVRRAVKLDESQQNKPKANEKS